MLPDENEIIALLRSWQQGGIDELAVLDAAERLEEASGVCGGVPKDDHRSPLFEILGHLAILHVQWLTPDDVPSMLAFLESARTDLQGAWTEWSRYMGSIDWERRRVMLLSNPFYLTAPLPQTKNG